ncbi:MAG: cohesin domain-containing protein [Chloroflexota bacterium]
MGKKYSRFVGLMLCLVILMTFVLPKTVPAMAADNKTEQQLPPGVVPDMSPLRNRLNPNSPTYHADFRYGGEGTRFGPPGKRVSAPLITQQQDQQYWGTKMKGGLSVTGVEARQKISTTLTVGDSNDWLYAPTLMAPDFCPVESVTVYHKNWFQIMERQWRVWDHVLGDFQYALDLDDWFIDNYVRDGCYKTQVIKYGISWWVMLYNYSYSVWEIKYSRDGGQSIFDFGWDWWEEWGMAHDWPAIPEIRSKDLQAYVNGYWYVVNARYGLEHYSDPFNTTYDYGWTTPYREWYIGTGLYDYLGETKLTEVLSDPNNRSSIVQVQVSLERITDKQGIPVQKNVKSYYAKTVYVNPRPEGVEMKLVLPGPSPFDSPSSNINNPGGETTFSQAAAYGVSPPTVFAKLVPILNGSAQTITELANTFLSMSTDTSESIRQKSLDPMNYLLRGDANKNGVVEDSDDDTIANYIVGNLYFEQIAGLNAATPHHNGANGDLINVFDAMYIAQYLAGLRNIYYEWVSGLSIKYNPVPQVELTVGQETVELPVGNVTSIPIIVKGIPANSAGLGCYNIQVAFDPNIVKIDSVTSDSKVFPAPKAVRIDNTRGTVHLNSFGADVPGVTGDLVLAKLVVTAVGNPGNISSLRIAVSELGDALGGDIPVKTSEGLVIITKG